MSITNNTLYTLLLHIPNPQHTQSRLTHKTAIMKRNHQLKAGFRQLTAQKVSFQSPWSSYQEATQSAGVLLADFLPQSGFRAWHSPEGNEPNCTSTSPWCPSSCDPTPSLGIQSFLHHHFRPLSPSASQAPSPRHGRWGAGREVWGCRSTAEASGYTLMLPHNWGVELSPPQRTTSLLVNTGNVLSGRKTEEWRHPTCSKGQAGVEAA